MKTEGVDLNKEGSADGYLGVDVQRDGRQITFTQIVLTKRITDAFSLDSKHSTVVATPAEKAALGKDIDGPPTSGQVNYASMIGMLLYLGHSHPNIAFATHQCAPYTFAPKQSHKNSLRRIGRYLKGTLDKGLILTPSDDLKIDCCPDANFAGLWNRKDENDPYCVCSQTGYIICLLDCLLLWISKLQTEITLSTMEAEYIALSASCRDLFPMIDVTNKICLALHLTLSNTTEKHIKIHKDYVGTLILCQVKPRWMTPCSKHYAVKYHSFWEHLISQKIQLVKIVSTDQLGNIFTKGLDKIAFQRL
jgi:hypothetical protein